MKSERRHELHTNALADWISNLPEWWEQNGRTIIYAVAALIVVAAVWYFAAVRTAAEKADQAQKLSEMLSTLENLKFRMARDSGSREAFSGQVGQLAGQLKNFADTAANPNAAAFALVKSAEAVRAASHYSPTIEDPETEAKALAGAKDSCIKAATLGKSDPAIVASANLQLGLCQESLGQFDDARKTYDAIVANPDFKGDVSVAQAQLRLAVMDDFKTPVLLAPAPLPKPVVMPAPAAPVGKPLPAGQLVAPPQPMAPTPAPAPAPAGTSTPAK
jgi:hypothetical protein